ncbi:hypothetical protein [Paenibacillus naphthalenovorans]|uniref:hypothetical protein n=1 Tax=Paenibacillus naphthalenovorans TaxID=162209 RepID=UPI003D26D6B5
MEKIAFEKQEIRDEVTDREGNIIQEGTPVTAELLNRYEETLAKLVEAHNQRVAQG